MHFACAELFDTNTASFEGLDNRETLTNRSTVQGQITGKGRLGLVH